MRCHRRGCMHYRNARKLHRGEEEEDENPIPSCEDLLTLFIILYSMISVYAAAYAYMRFQRMQEAILANTLTLIPREQWDARPPSLNPEVLDTLPARLIIVIHTSTQNCGSLVECARVVKAIQDLHMDSLGRYDIGYNFLVGGDGNAYEGRGWDVAGAHTLNFDHRSIGLAFIGNFSQAYPSERQLRAARNLINEGIKYGNVSKDYVIVGQRQCVPTTSPGDGLYEIIKYWKHWWSACK